MFDSYLQLAANTFFSNLIFPIDQEYVEIVMLSAVVSYNKFVIYGVIFIFKFLALFFNMLIGLAFYNSFKKFINDKGLNNILVSQHFFDKYCFWFIPLFAFISPLLLIVFTLFFGFLRLFKFRVLSAMGIEIIIDCIEKIFL
jgi:hypothetical protein